MEYLEAYLKKNIPLFSCMDLTLKSFSQDELIMKVPLKPNKNDKNTAFAGSIYSSAVLTGWGFLFLKLRESLIENDLVVYKAEIQYFKPISGNFETLAHFKLPHDWESFLAQLKDHKKAKISLEIEIKEMGETKALLKASYSAKIKP